MAESHTERIAAMFSHKVRLGGQSRCCQEPKARSKPVINSLPKSKTSFKKDENLNHIRKKLVLQLDLANDSGIDSSPEDNLESSIPRKRAVTMSKITTVSFSFGQLLVLILFFLVEKEINRK